MIKRKERTSYAFLMEMVCVCAFFLICACIFVMTFAKAEQVSRRASALSQATQAASNAIEEMYFAYDTADNNINEILLQESERLMKKYSTNEYTVNISYEGDETFMRVTVQTLDKNKKELITINGAKAGGDHESKN